MARPMRDLYALQKLTEAVYVLATGSGRVQERLRYAAIHLLPLRPEDIPDENLRRTFTGVMDDLTFEQAQADEGQILATLKITDDEDARAIARCIFELHRGLERLARERG
jgi:hypothetical protein